MVRLRYALYRAQLGRSVGATLGMVVGVLFGGLVLLATVIGLVGLRSAGVRGASMTVVIFAPLMLLWPTFALVGGSDSSLEPRRFATLPTSPGSLSVALVVGGLSGIPSLFLTAACLAQVIPWTMSPATAGAALVSAVVGVLTVVVATRAVLGSLARLMRTRRGRALGAALTAIVSLGPFLFNIALTGVSRAAPNPLLFDGRPAAQIASATPFGWAWALPYDVATGHPWRAGVHLALALALVGALWWLWQGRVRAALTQPPFDVAAGRVKDRPRSARVRPQPVWRTVARRRSRAWRRDPRLLGLGVRLLAFPMVMIAYSLVSPFDFPALAVGLAFLALSGGFTLSTELAFDGPAWWIDVSIGVAGVQDRVGRLVAVGVVVVPVVALLFGATVLLGLVTDPLAWSSVIIVAFGASSGLGLVLGALHPGVAPRIGDSPFSSPPGSVGPGCLLGVIGLVGPLVLIAPVAVAAWFTRDTVGSWVTLAGSIAYAAVLLAVGVVVGGRLLDQRAPELLRTLVDQQK